MVADGPIDRGTKDVPPRLFHVTRIPGSGESHERSELGRSPRLAGGPIRLAHGVSGQRAGVDGHARRHVDRPGQLGRYLGPVAAAAAPLSNPWTVRLRCSLPGSATRAARLLATKVRWCAGVPTWTWLTSSIWCS